MGKKLVIVESPAKARTISRFLGPDYVVDASYGHVRDLPTNRRGLPEDLRKKWWADYGVDIDNGFEPFYEIPSDKVRHISRLRDALKSAEALVLATDEDREGESISWHLLQVLKPKKSVKVERIAFHEITAEAIREALANPRAVDENLVEAQEARRILDRLYGYTLSPLLWRLVAPDLSAGRVQSPAVKLIVQRERERHRFREAGYWDLEATFNVGQTVDGKPATFAATLKSLDGRRVANGQSFNIEGELAEEAHYWLKEEEAARLAEAALPARPWVVTVSDRKPGMERQPEPFRTTTFQQEANRKLGLPADRAMRIAQELYEGIDIGGNPTGLISYMRTDSLALADEAVRQIRSEIQSKFGAEYLPAKPHVYRSKVANAQEAHEAIRPTDIHRTPESIRADLMRRSEQHYAVYDLIWRRTLACQMRAADVMRSSIEIAVDVDGRPLTFGASGKEIVFPGFLRAYVEDVDDPDAEIAGKERILPRLTVGEQLNPVTVTAEGHATKPPARYTEATLVKKLEELAIGRPSTYATILRTIEDRGYVRKVRKELVPTIVAFLTMEVLDNHFQEFMDLGFTAKMDERLDDIANGQAETKGYLREFFFGENGRPGLKDAVAERRAEIPFPAVRIGVDPESGKEILIRLSKRGSAFVQLGPAADKKFADVPDDLAPADLTVEKALELLAGKKSAAESIGVSPEGRPVRLMNGRFGAYIEAVVSDEERAAGIEPKRVTLPPDLHPSEISDEVIADLLQLPRTLGTDQATGEPVIAASGRYGGYVKCGSEIRNLGSWREAITITLEEAQALLAQPKTFRRAARTPVEPMRTLENVPGAAGPVRVMSGRFGPYVTDGETNATIPKDVNPAEITAEQAGELLERRRQAPTTGRKPVRRGRTTAKATKAPAKKKPTTRKKKA